MPGRVLLLGAGRTTGPVLDYFGRHEDFQITIVSAVDEDLKRANAISPRSTVIKLDILNDTENLKSLLSSTDVVIGLIPEELTDLMVKLCVEVGCHLVTASYYSDETLKLHSRAKLANVTILNEIGLDPGLDHLVAVKCFDEIKAAGGKVISYECYCGGLPAPESARNTLKYKFSWNPRSSVHSCICDSQYLLNGERVMVPEVESGSPALLQSAVDIDLDIPGLELEGFPHIFNFDYIEAYGIPDAKTCIRGTLRYKGFAEKMIGLIQLGLLDMRPHPLLSPSAAPITWRKFVGQLVGADKSCSKDELEQKVLKKLENKQDRLDAVVQLKLLDDEKVINKDTPLDTLVEHLIPQLTFEPGERDMVIMQHRVGVQWPDGSTETRIINLQVYGDVDGYTAMAKTVGYTISIAAKMIVDGKFCERGILMPLNPLLHKLLLPELEKEGIIFLETSVDNNTQE